MNFDIKDPAMAEEGRLRAEWAAREMPVLSSIRERFSKERPLEGKRVSGCLHITAETALLAKTIMNGGAQLTLCASNPLSTQNDIAAHLVEEGVNVFAIKGENRDTYYAHMSSALSHEPQITIDDGADLVAMLHKERTDILENLIGGMEETTTGVIRLKALESDGRLRYPIVAVNDSRTKHMFDNRYGTGQSSLDGIIRATNILITGKNIVTIGYGWCGKGFAARAKGMGAHTIVCEVDSVRALEAVMDGHRVMSIEDAAVSGDIFLTVTGGINAIDRHHFEAMKDGAIVANSGHFDVELNLHGLDSMTESKRSVRPNMVEHLLENGKRVFVLAEGRLVNLSAAEGHPPSVMDMSFANQALASEYIVKNQGKLKPGVHVLPSEIDNRIAEAKLLSMGIKIDKLTSEQERYRAGWELGT